MEIEIVVTMAVLLPTICQYVIAKYIWNKLACTFDGMRKCFIMLIYIDSSYIYMYVTLLHFYFDLSNGF